jgi:ribosomal-protein-serine acetyltransferase
MEVLPNIRIANMKIEQADGLFQVVDQHRTYLRRWLPWVDFMKTAEDMQQYIQKTIAEEKEGVTKSWVIFHKEDIIGRIGLHKIDHWNRQAEIGYWISETFQGKGITKAVTAAIIEFAFSTLQLHRIEIRCAAENINSQRIPEKLQFRREGLLHEANWLNGGFVHIVIYGLTKSEWRTIH